MTMLRYAVKELKKRRGRYLLNIFTVAMVASLLIILSSLGAAYEDAAKLPFEDIHSSIIIQRNGNVPENTSGVVLSCSLAPMGQDTLVAIRGIDGVKGVSAGAFLWDFDTDHFKRVLGVDWKDGLGERVTSRLVSGTVPQDEDQALVEKTYAQQYGLDLGGHTKISGRDFTISGIVETTGKEVASSDIVIGLPAAQDLAYGSKNLQKTETFRVDDVNLILVDAEQTKVKETTERLKVVLGPGDQSGGKTPTGNIIGTYNIYTPESFEDQISSLFLLSTRLMLLISVVAVAGAAFVILKGTGHTILERRKDFGTMKAVGFTNRDIQGQVVLETFLQLAAGFVLGLLVSLGAISALARTTISIVIPWELNPYPHFLLSNPNLANTIQTYYLPIRFHMAYALGGLIVIFTIGLLTAVAVTRQVNRLQPMEVLRYE